MVKTATFRNLTQDTRYVNYGTLGYPAATAVPPDGTVTVIDEFLKKRGPREKDPDGKQLLLPNGQPKPAPMVEAEVTFADAYRLQESIWAEVLAPGKSAPSLKSSTPPATDGADKEVTV